MLIYLNLKLKLVLELISYHGSLNIIIAKIKKIRLYLN